MNTAEPHGAAGKSNSPGGLPIFRGIDHPGAFCFPEYHTGVADVGLKQLESWFSPARMSRYADCDHPGLLYVWNARLSKAFLEDVGHVEVLLRNFIDQRLAADCGQRQWYHEVERYHFNKPFQFSVAKAEKHLLSQGRTITSDQVIAGLSFDNWRFLLTHRHEVTIWKALICPANGGMPYYPRRRRQSFETDVEMIRQLRNRASHQEPLIIKPQQTIEETTLLDTYMKAIDNTARRIDPQSANWIALNSRVAAIRDLRPDING